MSRATDNAVIELWRVQARLGIKVADRVLPEPPYRRWRHPPGCPDSDWCSGNGCCYWDCQADPDLDAYERTLEAIRKLISGEHHV